MLFLYQQADTARLANDGKDPNNPNATATIETEVKWFSEDIPLPPTAKFDNQLVINAAYDLKKGGVGLDNVHVYTDQK